MAVLGIDIGGSTIKAAPVDLVAGTLAADPREIETPRPATPARLATAVAGLVDACGDDFDGPVGCTFPGRVHAGTSLSATNLDDEWIGRRPGDLFEEAIGRRVVVANDADAAGVAEMTFGAGAGRAGVVLMVTLGTGIGTAVFVDGALLPNSELGEVDIDGEPACERLSKDAREAAGGWEAWLRDLSRFLQRMQDLIDPGLIIIGGGVSERPEVLDPALHQPVEVVPAVLGNAAGMIGAALIASRDG